jgi:hypothetical protein
MKLVSFDVGIKNMAYCIFDVSFGSPMLVKEWNVINLMDKSEVPILLCNCHLPAKNKKKSKVLENVIVELCGKKAKFKKRDNFFCEKHSKKQTEYLTPNKECSPSSIKKLKNGELIDICKKYTINIGNAYLKKDILDIANAFFENKMLEIIIFDKEKTASETDLITIGKNLKIELDKVNDLLDVTHVIIENQISPIANRMKTIQGMLAQYFIMTGSQNIHIEFVSSLNKLKGYDLDSIKDTDNENKYKQHKKDSIIICNRFLENNENLQVWSQAMTTSKKDDLADSFLQGIWYLKSKKVITNAEDLKITNL